MGNYFSDQRFENKDFTKDSFNIGEYENCIFLDCNFEYIDLSRCNFNDCAFTGCNLSMVKLISTAFRDVLFSGCKMFGLQFNDCNEFGLSFTFEDCLLNNSIFYKTSLKKIRFKNSRLTEVDFSEADLSYAVFTGCDFTGAVFDRSNLEKADFRTSFNYSINPSVNRLKKARFSLSEIQGLLRHLDIEIDKNS